MLKVGYVGLGAMGSSLSKHLTDVFDLTVFDRNPVAVSALVAQGAKQASSGAELARACDVIVLCLPRTSDVQDALFGLHGLVEGLSPGKLVIDQTSGIPRETAAIAENLASRGVAMVDAPVSGGIPAAQNRKVTVIASGSDAAWATAEPVLLAMTNSVFRCSTRVGDGQALKLVNNAIGAGYRMATLELVALGRKMGLSLSSLVKTLNDGQGANFTTRHMLVGLLEGRSTTNFALALMIKDLDAALSLGTETVSPMPMTSGARDLMQMGLNLFGHNAVLDDVIPLIEKRADIKFKSDGGSAQVLRGGVDETALLSLIDRAVMACNAVTVVECVAMGQRFGLPLSQMARILSVGSAWSKVSEIILPASVSQSVPQLGCTIEKVRTALTTLSGHAAQIGVPLTLPNALLNTFQSTLRKPKEMVMDFGAVCQF
jgi:3-hydroxyisobutyrate dehydrogenase